MGHRNLVNYLVYGIMFLFAMVLTVMSPLLADISKTFSLNIAQTGIIFTANFLGFVFFIIIGGILADRWGKRKVLAVSLVGFTVSLLLLPFAPNFFLALLSIVLIGGFGGSVESVVSSLITEINTDKPSFYLNFAQVFFGLGAIVGPIGAGFIVSKGFSWQICYLVLGALTLIVTLLFFKIKLQDALGRPLPQPEKITFTSFGRLIMDPKLLIICLCMAFYTGSEIGGWGWMSTFLKENLKFSATKSSLAVALFWGGMTISRFICGRLSLRFNIRDIIIVLAFLSALITVLSGYITDPSAVLVVVVAMGFAYSSLWPMIASYGGNFHHEYSGTVFALLIASGGIGATVVPLAMGFLAQNINIRMATISPGILFLLIGMIFINLKKFPIETASEKM